MRATWPIQAAGLVFTQRFSVIPQDLSHQGRSGQLRKISPLPGFDPRTVQLVGSRYTYYATRSLHSGGSWFKSRDEY
jgi:hypothetical protein